MTTQTALLQLEGLTQRFKSGFTVGPINASLGPGLYHLQGANGSGKTSLLKTICGQWKPSAGRCLVRGQDTWSQHKARGHIGLLPAHPDQPGFMTVDECWRFHAAMRCAPDWDGVTLRQALGLPGDLPLEHGSAGQRRRAELLAALAGDPCVLLLDEPFANLDTEALALVRGWLERWRTQRVIVLIDHQPPQMDMDACWVLQPGTPMTLA